MSNEEDYSQKIQEQNQTVEDFFTLLKDVDKGEKVSMKALSVYQLQGSGFVQVNNGNVKGVMRSNDKMVVDKYSPVNEDIENIDDETVIELEDRTIVGVDEEAAMQLGTIINQAMQDRNMEKKKKSQNLGINENKDLGYIG